MATTVVVISCVVLVVALFALELLWDRWRSGRWFCIPMPRPYRDRDSQEVVWQERHGDDKTDKVDVLLTILCDAFSFNPDHRWRFSPDDKIMDIYRAVYPKRKFWIMADCMEIETLLPAMEEKFGLEMDEQRIEMTLGEIVDLVSGKTRG